MLWYYVRIATNFHLMILGKQVVRARRTCVSHQALFGTAQLQWLLATMQLGS